MKRPIKDCFCRAGSAMLQPLAAKAKDRRTGEKPIMYLPREH